jgi:hypothetical protein
MGKQYYYNERIIGVHRKPFEAVYLVAWYLAGIQHPIRSRYLPVCKTPKECQKHLDAWALRKGLNEAWDGRLPEEEETPRPGCEVYEGGLEEDRSYFLKSRDKAENPRAALYVGLNGGKHVFLFQNKASVMTEKMISPAALCHYEIRAHAL